MSYLRLGLYSFLVVLFVTTIFRKWGENASLTQKVLFYSVDAYSFTQYADDSRFQLSFWSMIVQGIGILEHDNADGIYLERINGFMWEETG